MIALYLACLGLFGPVLFIFGAVLMHADTEPSDCESFHSDGYKKRRVLDAACRGSK